MPELEGQVVIITGASAGIGAETARRLARGGARVALNARRQDRLDALKKEIEAAGGKATAVAGDVTSPDDRRRLVDETLKAHSRIDGLVNNAGYGQRGPLEIVPIEAIRKNFETNVFSLLALTQLVMPVMRGQGSGTIVNISSVAGRIARPFSSIYDSTKHALEALSDGMRGEMAPFGVRVVIIEPGFIITEFLEVANSIASQIPQRESPYSSFLKGIDNGVQRFRRFAGTPDDIARLVERALTASKPKLRYAAPAHAHIFLALKWLMPEGVLDRLMNRQMGLTPERLRSGSELHRQPAGES
ncbi:MAG TPA: SDR family NAD(P)-dependent oxidoreductase [Blastocatellia bacterium]